VGKWWGKKTTPDKKPADFQQVSLPFSGAGGIRTRVQTSNPWAFYMFSLFLVFDHRPRTNTLSAT